MLHFPRLLSCAALLALAAACGAPPPAETTGPASQAETAVVADQGAALNAWFEEKWEEGLLRSPERLTFQGRKERYGEWDDESPAFRDETYRLQQAAVEEMRARFDFNALDPSAQLSWRLMRYAADEARRARPFHDYWYEFSHFRGPHSGIPSFMINQHRVASMDDAEAYVSRLEGVRAKLGQHQANAEAQFAKGVYPPKWSYPQMIETSRNVITGAPFDGGADSVLYTDLKKKIAALDADEATKNDLLARGRAALINSVKPGYEGVIAMFEKQVQTASNDDGVWKLPDGAAYYESQLRRMTTTDMTAAEIHDLGLSEVARIHAEMDGIREKVGFEGDLKAFFAYMRDDPDGKFTYPNTDEGRARYLAEATALIDAMRERLDELFYTKPKADLVVQRVEPFRERSAGKAFYQRPAPDGSRPGIYYANLYDMAYMPTYQMEALAYHEGIPGHHMQIAIAQELEGVPSFRRFGGYTAYSEGWGLYSELVPKEMGLYADPYSDFGRLAMELWRAGRLVVDTGIHAKKWTREQAIAYLVENTPNPEGDAEKSIERYIVMPGQATAYKIGMLKILELRERAENSLGERFDVRAFHDVVLKDGFVPLAILEENVDRWIAETAAS